jgi:hypothetical protein|tara:strand:- start:626 stop:979 length:354 start_codon:yes stop_codon:yes gene_type:complete
MLFNLSEDSIRYIALFLKIYDIVNFSLINKITYKAIDKIFYDNLALKIYGKQFWIDAYNRPQIISKPSKSLKEELIKIEIFQNKLEKKNKRWSNKDFYNYWKQDKMRLLYIIGLNHP